MKTAVAYSFLRFWVLALLLAGVLTACGASDAVDPQPSPTTPTPATSFADYQVQYAGLQSNWGGKSITNPAGLPLGGSATYSGVMLLGLETASGNLRMYGALSLTSNFYNNSLSGRATNFTDETEATLTGTLDITGGVLDRGANVGVDFTYSALIAGTLDGGGNSFAISGDISGDFLGASNEATRGIVSGTATSGFGTGYVFGDYIAKR